MKHAEGRVKRLELFIFMRSMKDLLYGDFSAPHGQARRTEAWEAVFQKGKELGLAAKAATRQQFRKNCIDNTVRRTREKVRKRGQTGQGYTSDVVLDELDEIILDIIGRDAEAAMVSVPGGRTCTDWERHSEASAGRYQDLADVEMVFGDDGIYVAEDPPGPASQPPPAQPSPPGDYASSRRPASQLPPAKPSPPGDYASSRRPASQLPPAQPSPPGDYASSRRPASQLPPAQPSPPGDYASSSRPASQLPPAQPSPPGDYTSSSRPASQLPPAQPSPPGAFAENSRPASQLPPTLHRRTRPLARGVSAMPNSGAGPRRRHRSTINRQELSARYRELFAIPNEERTDEERARVRQIVIVNLLERMAANPNLTATDIGHLTGIM